MESKQCSKCKETKALSEFNTRPDRRCGYRSECKKCQYRRQLGRKRTKEKASAYNRFHYAKRKGRIQKPLFCEKCGEAKQLSAHHYDYRKPFDVQWLCNQCHFGKRKCIA
jgi:hypothetical protein